MPGVRSDSLGIPCNFSELAQSCPELARSSLVHRAKSGMSGFDGLPPVPEEDGFVVAAAVAAVPHGTESVMRGSHRNNRGLHFFAHLIPDRFRFACTPPEKSLTWSSWHGIGDPHSTVPLSQWMLEFRRDELRGFALLSFYNCFDTWAASFQTSKCLDSPGVS